VNPVEASDALHARVTAFGLAALDREPGAEAFDRLALDIARYQARYVPGFARLVASQGAPLRDAASIPAVPVEAFRLGRVAAHPEALDAARFVTSGTTSEATGTHPFRTTATYRTLALAFGARALLSERPGPRTAVALLPPPGRDPASSLAFMARCFMEAWDGRALEGGAFSALEPGRWLAGVDGVDVAGLERAALVASRRQEPLVVIATGFALVLLLDRLAERSIPLPPHSVLVPTGGVKGRARDIDPATLGAEAAVALGLPATHVVGEYGMTELSSQMYEGTLPGGALEAPRGVFLPPPWLRVTPVDPITFAPAADGEVGLARFVDLANVDSAVCIVTQDLVRARARGIELVGRQRGAPARGCSLALEQMVR
jgi:hypothetical protein